MFARVLAALPDPEAPYTRPLTADLTAAVAPRPSAAAFLAVLLLYVTATSMYEAMHRPFWYDEVFTVVLTRLSSMAEIRAALANAADSSAPGFYIIQRALSGIAANEHLGFRLASIAAVTSVSLFVFVFARRHLPFPAAGIAAVIPLLSHLYHHYSVEARPYALVAGFAALAMVAWQRAASRGWVLVLAAGLAAAVSVSYYAVFAIAPFAMAEAVHFSRSKRLRPAVWVALAAGAIPLLVNWPLLNSYRESYGKHYWAKAHLSELPAGYDWFFVIRRVEGGGFLVAAAVYLALALYLRRSSPSARTASGTPPPETVALVLGLIALPVLVLGAGLVLDGGFVPRYSIAVIPGIALGVAYATQLLAPRYVGWMFACLLVVFGVREAKFWMVDRWVDPAASWAEIEAHERVMAHADDNAAPIVVEDGTVFVPLAYYRAEPGRSRLVALSDPEAARQYSGVDSLDIDLAALRSYMPVRVLDYEALLAPHKPFFLYSTPESVSWLPSRLSKDEYALDVVAREEAGTLYRVSRSERATGSK